MSLRSGAAMAALVGVAAAGTLTAREWTIGQAEVTAADAAAARSDWGETIVHARAAAEAAAPGSPWPERGWSRLVAVGHDAEARGDDPTATLAYGAMRATALATRAPGLGSGAGSERWRHQAEEGLARVAASHKDTAGTAGSQGAAQSMLDALRSNEPPTTGTLALLGAAGVAMLAGLGWLTLDGRGAETSLASTSRAGRVAQALAAVGFVVYAAVLLLN